jgi:hypothetical protein
MLHAHESETMLTIDSDIGALGSAVVGLFGGVIQRHVEVDLASRTVRARTSTLYEKKHEDTIAFADVGTITGTTNKDFAHVRLLLVRGGDPVELVFVPRTSEQSRKAAELAQKIANGIGVQLSLDDGFGKLFVWR